MALEGLHKSHKSSGACNIWPRACRNAADAMLYPPALTASTPGHVRPTMGWRHGREAGSHPTLFPPICQACPKYQYASISEHLKTHRNQWRTPENLSCCYPHPLASFSMLGTSHGQVGEFAATIPESKNIRDVSWTKPPPDSSLGRANRWQFNQSKSKTAQDRKKYI